MTTLRLSDLHPRRFFLETWRELDDEAAAYRAEHGRTDAGTVAYVYIVAAICLTLSDLNYLGGENASWTLINWLDSPNAPVEHPIAWFFLGWLTPESGSIAYSEYLRLWHLVYWVMVKVIAYLVIPSIAIAVHPRLSFRAIGFNTEGIASHFRIYGVLFIPVLIAVIIVSFTDEFTLYYPFYEESMRSPFDFWIWEGFYILQFFALEFLFRGFMLQPARRSMGASCIVAMMLPYVMIHFGKPITETFAAVLAGVILGTLALKTRSIWAGFYLHVSVALSMDIASNLQKGGVAWLKSLF